VTRRVLVVAHRTRPEAVEAREIVLHGLGAAGVEPVLATDDSTPDGLPEYESAIVLGGDGTILRGAELTRSRGVPMLGVNLGHVGFLAEIEPDDVAGAVRRLTTGEYEVEERGTIDVRVIGPDGVVAADWALNEAAMEKTDAATMIEVTVEVDGRPLSTFGTDGLVLATPTGSTAHAFSGGGPVVWPDVDGLIVVPLAAHALFARPLVVGPSSTVAVEVHSRSATGAVLVCDGRRRLGMPIGSRVEVDHSDLPVRLARLNPAPFTSRLVSKFGLSVEGWRGRPHRANGGST
jgi:NAD+ kinase